MAILTFPDVDAALATMAKGNPSAGIIAAAVKVLTSVVKNILAAPAEPKFRTLKKKNKAVETKILPCRGALQLMISVGFRSVTVGEDAVLALADERLDVPRLEHAQAGLAGVEGVKQAKAAAAIQAAAAARAKAKAEQQRLKREDQLARERVKQQLAEQREEVLAKRAAEAQGAAAVASAAAAAPAAAPAAAAASGAVAASETAASSSSRRQKPAPKRAAPAAPAPEAASGPIVLQTAGEGPGPAEATAAAAAAAASAAELDAAEAEATQSVKRKQSTEMDAATAEFQQPKKRRRFSTEDAATRIKGTHPSQQSQDASGAYGVVGRNAEASARQNAVSEGRFVVTERKVAAANGGGAKLEVLYKLANGRSESQETVQKFDRQQLQEVFRHYRE